MNVLVVDDEEPVRDMVALALERDGFTVAKARDSVEARNQLQQKIPAVVILDWMMPGQSGIEFCREIKSQPSFKDIPIIMLTARVQEEDVLNGFDQGVDDYLKKPFSIRELRARVRAVIKRSYRLDDSARFQYGPFSIDHELQQVEIDGVMLKLSPMEYRVLSEMLQRPGKVYSRSLLLDRVWGMDSEIDERTVDATMRRVRKVLKQMDVEEWLETVWGSGYRIKVSNR